MKILYVTHVNGHGGASVALANLAKGMAESGHEVYILSNSVNGFITEQLKGCGIHFLSTTISLTIYPKGRRLTGKFFWFAEFLYRWPKAYCEIKKYIKQYHIDLVHTNVGPCILPFLAARKLGVPHVWHMREYQDRDFGMATFPSKRYFQKLILSDNNYNIAITKGVFSHWNLRPDKDVVIYDGVFSKEYQPVNFPKEKTVLFVGRIEEAKGLMELLQAFKIFVETFSEYKLQIAGGINHQDYYDICQSFIKENALSDCVQFLGVRGDVYELMARSEMLVVPSRFEGFGFIVVEAMLNGCIVIGRDTAGIKEQFDNGLELAGREIGYRFSSVDELVESMKNVASSSHDKMIEDAERVVRKSYSVQLFMENVTSFYMKVATE